MSLARISEISYQEARDLCKNESVSKERVEKWYKVLIPSEKIFINMVIWVDKRMTLEDHVLNNWRGREAEGKHPIDIDKIEDIENEIMIKNSYNHLEPIMLRDLDRGEKMSLPKGSFCIDDGLHRSLAIAELLIRKQIKFTPFLACYGALSSIST